MDSSLNPNAEAFEPGVNADLSKMIQDGYKSMFMAVCASNTFPIGTSYTLFQTFGSFNTVNKHLVGTALMEANRITQHESPMLKLNIDEDPETNMDKIDSINDFIMDRLNFTMDIESGQHEKWNSTPWSSQPMFLSTRSKNVSLEVPAQCSRPQIWFTEKTDNSDNIFVPSLQYKSNSLTPLALQEIHDEHGILIGYEHPYKAELSVYTPPDWAINDEWQPPIPSPIEGSVFRLVNSTSTLNDLLAHLDTVQEIAIDLEHNSYRSYLGITCLIQITTHTGGDFIIDPLGLRSDLQHLNKVFTDPQKIKVFHGADNDIEWLQRDFGVYVVGMFDTHQAAVQLNLQGRSLKHLLKLYCDHELDKTHQLADWRIRPIPVELVNYARNDTHYLLFLWRRMRQDLRSYSPKALQNVFEMSRQICLKTYVKPVLGPDSHMGVYCQSRKRFNSAQMTALRTGWAWRDQLARRLDESPNFILPNHMLLAVAEALPRDMQGLRAICVPMPPCLKDVLHELHTIILASRVIPEEEPIMLMPASVAGTLTPPEEFTYDKGSFSRSTVKLPAERAPRFCTPPVSPVAFQELLSRSLAELEKTKLSADAQSFVPPFDRYSTYKVITQALLKVSMEKEAKIEAISHGNDFIPIEVLQPGYGSVPLGQPSTSQGWSAQPSTSDAWKHQPLSYQRWPVNLSTPTAWLNQPSKWPAMPSVSHRWPAIPSTSHTYINVRPPCYQYVPPFPPPRVPHMFKVPTKPEERQPTVSVPAERKRKMEGKEMETLNQAETCANASNASSDTSFNADANTTANKEAKDAETRLQFYKSGKYNEFHTKSQKHPRMNKK